MTNVILCNIEDARKIIEEERLNWTFDVLDALDIPEEVYEVGTIDEYRNRMDEFGVEVMLDTIGSVNIYKKEWYYGNSEDEQGWLPPESKHLVAQWKQPVKVRKVEGRKVYYEIHLNEWSILKMRR